MSPFVLQPLDRDGVSPLPISARMRSQLVYFAVNPGGSPPGENEYQFDPTELKTWLDDGVISLVSPLDTANFTEVELSEEQEAVLGWLLKEKVGHVRVVEK